MEWLAKRFGSNRRWNGLEGLWICNKDDDKQPAEQLKANEHDHHLALKERRSKRVKICSWSTFRMGLK